MGDIRHRLGIAAPPAAIYEQLATVAGLRRWWTEDTTGDAVAGGKLTFTFGAPDRMAVMEVVEHADDRRVVWRCVDGPEEWIDTTFTFELVPAAGETVVLFTNEGWRRPVEFIHHCTTKWGSYLMSLRSSVEQGAGRPFPRDVKISGWD